MTDDGNLISAQLGPGAYTSPSPGEWPGSGNSWFCVILADSDAVDRVSKAWVPASYEGVDLWYQPAAIDEYIKKLESSWDPAKTLRLSKISGTELLQLLIPPGLLNSNGGGMRISASCKPTVGELPSVRVNYDDWQNNIKGDKDVKDDDDDESFIIF